MRNPLLAQAIAERRLIELRYGSFVRVVEPHAYGVDASGVEKLRCWQVSGGSDSAERSGWKLFMADHIRSTTMCEGQFSSARPGYKRQDTAMRRIYAQL